MLLLSLDTAIPVGSYLQIFPGQELYLYLHTEAEKPPSLLADFVDTLRT